MIYNAEYFQYIVTSSLPTGSGNCYGSAIAYSSSGSLAIGAFKYGSNVGCVTFFTRSASTDRFSEIQNTGSAGGTNQYYGGSIACLPSSSAAFVIGANGYQPSYVLTSSAVDGLFYIEQKLTGTYIAGDEHPGSQICCPDSENIVMGTPEYNTSWGRVYHFQKNSTTGGNKFYLCQQIASPALGTHFGYGLSTYQNRLMIAGKNSTIYSYLYNTGSYGLCEVITNTSSLSTDRFGRSLFLTGNYMIVGSEISGTTADYEYRAVTVYSASTNYQDPAATSILINNLSYNVVLGDKQGFSVVMIDNDILFTAPNYQNDTYGALIRYSFTSGQYSTIMTRNQQADDYINSGSAISEGYSKPRADDRIEFARDGDVNHIFVGCPNRYQVHVYTTGSDDAISGYGGTVSEITNFTSSGGYIK